MQIGQLRSLVTLKIADNLLRSLPQSIGKLTALKFLNVQKNLLDRLPGSMMNLRLDHLDVSSNSFGSEPPLSENHMECVPTLVEIAARFVINSR